MHKEERKEHKHSDMQKAPEETGTLPTARPIGAV